LGYYPFSGPVVIESKVVIRLRSIDEEFHVRAVDLARLLKTTENEISRLVRSGVITRVPDPDKRKAFLYPCLANVTRFCEFRFGKREAINQEFLTEKTAREKAQRLAIEMTNRQRAGDLVDKVRLIQKLEPVVIAFRESLLARTDRLVGELSRTKSRQEKVRRLREADMQSLGVLSDLFKRAGTNETVGNGAKTKMS
jgi:hypothetical protein